MHILLIKTSSMGDVIHALPALSDARQIFPDIKIDWVVEEAFAEIPSWHKAINAVIPIAFRRWRKKFWHLWKNKEMINFLHQLRATKYDYIIDAQGLYKSGMIAFMARGLRCGYNFKTVREPLASLFYNRKYSIATNQHAITRIRQLFSQALDYKNTINLNHIDYGIKDKLINPTKILPQISPSFANLLATLKNTNYFVFIHGTSSNEKRWAEEKWIELARHINTHKLYANYKILLPWATDKEQQLAQSIANNAKNIQVLPKLNLTELAKIILHTKGIIAVDTGLGHLAAALEKPVISLYGPTNPALIGARGKNVVHLTDFQNITAQEILIKLQAT